MRTRIDALYATCNAVGVIQADREFVMMPPADFDLLLSIAVFRQRNLDVFGFRLDLRPHAHSDAER